MRSVLIAAMTALVLSLLGTPWVVRLFRRRGYGQEIREDGPSSHAVKRGTPTMGGTVIIVATLVGYFVAHLFVLNQHGRGPTASALLVLALMTGLGLVGFLDDFIKIRKQRNLGLNKTAKLVGQLLVGVAFAVLALNFESGLNDGICVPVVIILLDLALGTELGRGGVAHAILVIAEEIGLGLITGIVLAAIAVRLLRLAVRYGWTSEHWLHIPVVALAARCWRGC